MSRLCPVWSANRYGRLWPAPTLLSMAAIRTTPAIRCLRSTHAVDPLRTSSDSESCRPFRGFVLPFDGANPSEACAVSPSWHPAPTAGRRARRSTTSVRSSPVVHIDEVRRRQLCVTVVVIGREGRSARGGRPRSGRRGGILWNPLTAWRLRIAIRRAIAAARVASAHSR